MVFRATLRTFAVAGTGLALLSCQVPDHGPAPPTGNVLVHLADRLEAATVVSGGAPETARRERRWRFDAPRPEWRTISSERSPYFARVERQQLDDRVLLSLSVGPYDNRFLLGGLAIDLGGLRFADWEAVLVRARSHDRLLGMTLAHNLDEEAAWPTPLVFFESPDEAPPVFGDGSEQTYNIPLRPRESSSSLRDLAVLFAALNPASVEVLSVELVPRGAAFLADVGARPVTRGGTTRHTLFAHAPAVLAFSDLPPGGRLDFGLSVIEGEEVTYRVSAELDGERRLLFEETVDDPQAWQQRSVTLPFASVSAVVLEADSERRGSVALWGAPILSGGSRSDRPNVVFYVIDGGDADLMSLYGYQRPTTPFLTELAREGVLFTRAYSNSTWTQPSTVSFMTSLHHSVLGGLRRGIHSTSVPAAATTMAEHFRRGGYQTASFTANPNAGRMVGLERGLDLLRDVETENHSTSSVDLHEHFWDFRDAYPGGPTWVHFQTTDVHEPNEPPEAFAGRFVTREERSRLDAWGKKIWEVAAADFGQSSVTGFYDLALERAGIDRRAYFETRRGLYDETMTHQDHTLEQLVRRLKEEGEWGNTLLVIGADHGHPAGTFARFGRALFDPQPEPWQGALFDAYSTRIPLLVIWPGHIVGGRTLEQPVSMIDILPTLLDLVGLPPPEILQGRSLAPLLRGQAMDVRPVILDEFRVDEATGEMIGNLEIIDGRWGASLEIAPVAEGADPGLGRHEVPAGGRWGAVHPFYAQAPRLLLYDLHQDPFALRAVNDQHPDVLARYRRVLREHWQAHRALATQFHQDGGAALDPEQLQQLRALGYIQ